MNLSDLEQFKRLLLEREQNLATWFESQTSLDKENAAKVRTVMGEIKDSLDRIENGTYGKCKECCQEMDRDRLEIQPTSQICLDCISQHDKEVLEEELSIATQIYQALLPQEIAHIDGFRIFTKYMTASAVGGDYYDFLPTADRRAIRVIIADIVGKGLPAGMLMSNLRGALRIYSQEITSSASLITRLNQWLCHSLPMSKFISLACLCVEPETNGAATITYTNAGHWPPILVHKDNSVERLNPTGGLLGVDAGFLYEEKQIKVYPKDLLVLFTDGITEAQNPSGAMFDEERLIEFLQKHNGDSPETLLDDLVNEVVSFSGKSRFEDDFTLIAIYKD